MPKIKLKPSELNEADLLTLEEVYTKFPLLAAQIQSWLEQLQASLSGDRSIS